jgi:hypothetical protein
MDTYSANVGHTVPDFWWRRSEIENEHEHDNDEGEALRLIRPNAVTPIRFCPRRHALRRPADPFLPPVGRGSGSRIPCVRTTGNRN